MKTHEFRKGAPHGCPLIFCVFWLDVDQNAPLGIVAASVANPKLLFVHRLTGGRGPAPQRPRTPWTRCLGCARGGVGTMSGERRNPCAPRGQHLGSQSLSSRPEALRGPRATPDPQTARARLWVPSRGATGRSDRARGAATKRRIARPPRFGCMPLGVKTAVARQRGRRHPQILAARASPSRW